MLESFFQLLEKTYSFLESTLQLYITEAISFRQQRKMEIALSEALSALYQARSITFRCISRCGSFRDSLVLQEELEMTSELNSEDLEEYNNTIKDMEKSLIYFQGKADELTKMIEQLEVFEN